MIYRSIYKKEKSVTSIKLDTIPKQASKDTLARDNNWRER